MSMCRADRRAIDAALPKEWHGSGAGWRRFRETIDARITVTGTRGKTGLTKMLEKELRFRGRDTFAKVTGTTPQVITHGRTLPVHRKNKRVMLDETLWEMKRYATYDTAIIENQGIGEYTMRTVNDVIVKPHMVLVSNLRRDHQDQVGPRPTDVAKAMGRSAPKGGIVFCGDQDPAALRVMERETRKRGAQFVHVATGPEEPPGMELVFLADRVIENVTGRRLDHWMISDFRRKSRQRFRWLHNPALDLWWHDASEANDIDSTRMIMDRLQHGEPVPLTWVLHLRADRRERSHAFLDLLVDAARAGHVEQLIVNGKDADLFAARLRKAVPGIDVRRVSDEAEHARAEVLRLSRQSRSRRVFMVGNGVPPWPRAAYRALKAGSHDTCLACARPGDGLPWDLGLTACSPSAGISGEQGPA